MNEKRRTLLCGANFERSPVNRASDRETRLVALESQIRDIAGLHEAIYTRMDLIDERLDRLTGAILKLSRELGVQREKYPLE